MSPLGVDHDVDMVNGPVVWVTWEASPATPAGR